MGECPGHYGAARRPAGFNRASLWVNRGVRFGFIGLARFARSFEAKDAILAAAAPVALVTQLFVWGERPLSSGSA